MSILKQKRILLGITGGIAAYKSADLVRRLQDENCDVRVVMTQSATEFVTPLTFQALSGNPVHTDLLDPNSEAAMGHIELARWADAILIAPCSANFIAKLAHGTADDLLSTLCLATDAPIAIAPAMNRLMWSNVATQENLKTLNNRKIKIFGPNSGSQACGEVGEGRMLDPEELIANLPVLFETNLLSGLSLLITAGPTREAIDPVRFISNHSSGKMGYAIAQAALEAGANVSLITGPTNLIAPERANIIPVETADEMLNAALSNIAQTDIFIATAAVADYRVEKQNAQKIKKADESIELKLVRNPDILATIASLDQPPFTVGFAAETEKLAEHAQEKLTRKGINMIAANWVNKSDSVFNNDNNALDVFWKNGHKDLPKTSKIKLAQQLVTLISEQFHSQKTTKSKQPTKENIT